jgi:hypothetical protein
LPSGANPERFSPSVMCASADPGRLSPLLTAYKAGRPEVPQSNPARGRITVRHPLLAPRPNGCPPLRWAGFQPRSWDPNPELLIPNPESRAPKVLNSTHVARETGGMKMKINSKYFRVRPGEKVKLKEWPTMEME